MRSLVIALFIMTALPSLAAVSACTGGPPCLDPHPHMGDGRYQCPDRSRTYNGTYVGARDDGTSRTRVEAGGVDCSWNGRTFNGIVVWVVSPDRVATASTSWGVSGENGESRCFVRQETSGLDPAPRSMALDCPGGLAPPDPGWGNILP